MTFLVVLEAIMVGCSGCRFIFLYIFFPHNLLNGLFFLSVPFYTFLPLDDHFQHNNAAPPANKAIIKLSQKANTLYAITSCRFWFFSSSSTIIKRILICIFIYAYFKVLTVYLFIFNIFISILKNRKKR